MTTKNVVEWLSKQKDPFQKLNETITNTSEIIKRLPELPNMMDKANEILTLITQRKLNTDSFTFRSLKEKELEMQLIRNKTFGGILVLVIFILIVFK